MSPSSPRALSLLAVVFMEEVGGTSQQLKAACEQPGAGFSAQSARKSLPVWFAALKYRLSELGSGAAVRNLCRLCEQICIIVPGNRGEQRLPRCSHTCLGSPTFQMTKKPKYVTNPGVFIAAIDCCCGGWRCNLLSQQVPYALWIRRWCSRAFGDLSINSLQMICLFCLFTQSQAKLG